MSHPDLPKTLSQDFQFSNQYARAYSGELKCVKDYKMLVSIFKDLEPFQAQIPFYIDKRGSHEIRQAGLE